MSRIGIDEDGFAAVEGKQYGARAIRPMPFLCPATVIFTAEDLAKIPGEQPLTHVQLIFREESFDPVTRIRRGRLYSKEGVTQPCTWNTVHGVAPGDVVADMRLVSYQSIPWSTLAASTAKAKLALGTREGHSLWDLILVERTAARYELLTLRARSNLSLMPEASELCIAADRAEIVQAAIDKALDTQRRLDADATVDACRHAAVTALRAWVGDAVAGRDLGLITDRLEKATPAPTVVAHIARIIARLHVRTKPSEREKHSIRANEQDDGDAAVSILGLLLRELRAPAPVLS